MFFLKCEFEEMGEPYYLGERLSLECQLKGALTYR
jgi:hypothetical protein